MKRAQEHIRSSLCLEALDTWLGWRGAGNAPKRSEMLTESFGKALPYINVLEFVSATECLFQFVGSTLVDVQGLDFTGRNFYDLTPKEGRELRMQRMHEVERRPCGTLSIIPGKLSRGGDHCMKFFVCLSFQTTEVRQCGLFQSVYR